MKKLLFSLFGVVMVLALAGCAEEEKALSCTLTSDDFTYENIGVYKYKIKLKDPNKSYGNDLFWDYEGHYAYNELEPLIYKSREDLSDKVVLYAKKEPNGFAHINNAGLQCGNLYIKPISTSPTCDNLKIKTDVGNKIIDGSYEFIITFNEQIEFDEMKIIYNDNVTSTFYQESKPGEYIDYIKQDELKNDLIIYRFPGYPAKTVFLGALVNIKYADGTNCAKEVRFYVTRLHPELQ